MTKSGNFRTPDYLIADRLVDWDWKETFRLKCGPEDTTHINHKELRALRMHVRRFARMGPSARGRRIVILCDSQVVVGALSRGRSASRKLNRAVKAFIPLLLPAHLYMAILWVPTGANPSDAPSRDSSLHAWLAQAKKEASERLAKAT
jgi:hypothetical protein